MQQVTIIHDHICTNTFNARTLAVLQLLNANVQLLLQCAGKHTLNIRATGGRYTRCCSTDHTKATTCVLVHQKFQVHRKLAA